MCKVVPQRPIPNTVAHRRQKLSRLTGLQLPMMQITPLTGTIGAELSGIDLKQPISTDLAQGNTAIGKGVYTHFLDQPFSTAARCAENASVAINI